MHGARVAHGASWSETCLRVAEPPRVRWALREESPRRERHGRPWSVEVGGASGGCKWGSFTAVHASFVSHACICAARVLCCTCAASTCFMHVLNHTCSIIIRAASYVLHASRTLVLTSPASTTYLTPSIVTDVSAIFVARMTFLVPSGGGCSASSCLVVNVKESESADIHTRTNAP